MKKNNKRILTCIALLTVFFFAHHILQAQGFDIYGAWQRIDQNGKPGGQASIVKVNVVVENNQPVVIVKLSDGANTWTDGKITGMQISASAWGVTGTLSNDRKKITWSNNTSWIKSSNPVAANPPNLNALGDWYAADQNHKPTGKASISRGNTTFVQGSNKYSLLLDNGGPNMVAGQLEGNNITVPDWGVTGSISQDGSIITWSNKTSWSKQDNAARPNSGKPQSHEPRPGFVWVNDHWEREQHGAQSPSTNNTTSVTIPTETPNSQNPTANAQADMTGLWNAVDPNNKPLGKTSIRKGSPASDGSFSYIFSRGSGAGVKGEINGSKIIVPEWNMTGNIGPAGKQIIWSNNNRWIKADGTATAAATAPVTSALEKSANLISGAIQQQINGKQQQINNRQQRPANASKSQPDNTAPVIIPGNSNDTLQITPNVPIDSTEDISTITSIPTDTTGTFSANTSIPTEATGTFSTNTIVPEQQVQTPPDVTVAAARPDAFLGTWTNTDGYGKPLSKAMIEQSVLVMPASSSVTYYMFNNGSGGSVVGTLQGTRIEVLSWHIIGTLSRGGMFIKWSNGTQWTKGEIATAAEVSPASSAPAFSGATAAVKFPGAATDIDAKNGQIYQVGTNPVQGGNDIWKWYNGQWAFIRGGAVRLAVSPNGIVWVIDNTGNIKTLTASGWGNVINFANAIDIAVDASDNVWVARQDSSIVVLQHNGTGFISQPPLGALPYRITAMPDGTVKITTKEGADYISSFGTASYTLQPAVMQAYGYIEISIDPQDGTQWAIDAHNNIWKLPAK